MREKFCKLNTNFVVDKVDDFCTFVHRGGGVGVRDPILFEISLEHKFNCPRYSYLKTFYSGRKIVPAKWWPGPMCLWE